MAKKTISDSKRKQLEAAGYTVSKSGKTVQTKDGGTVAGINENGNFFGSANSKAFKILKGEEVKPKPKAKPKAKPKSSSSAPKSTSTRPQARRTEGQIRSSSGGRTRYTPPSKDIGSSEKDARDPKNYTSSGRGKGMYELGRRAIEQPDYKDGKRKEAKRDSNVKAGYGSLANAKNRMESFKVSRQDKTINGVSFDEWKKLTRAQRVEKNLPLTSREFMRAMRLKGEDVPPAVSAGSRRRQQTTPSNYTQEDLDRRSGGRRTGMSKGGMVKSGNKDYKKSGMFYKSPRASLKSASRNFCCFSVLAIVISCTLLFSLQLF